MRHTVGTLLCRTSLLLSSPHTELNRLHSPRWHLLQYQVLFSGDDDQRGRGRRRPQQLSAAQLRLFPRHKVTVGGGVTSPHVPNRWFDDFYSDFPPQLKEWRTCRVTGCGYWAAASVCVCWWSAGQYWARACVRWMAHEWLAKSAGREGVRFFTINASTANNL